MKYNRDYIAMWKKDNEIFAGRSLVFDGVRYFNPSAHILEAAGYTWVEDADSTTNAEDTTPKLEQYTAEFEAACESFRQLCVDIGKLIGVSNFRGGFDEMAEFENNPAAATPEGLALSVKWMAADKLCTYLASKLGIGQPEWWYRCWEAELNYAQSNAIVQEESAFAEIEDLTLNELEL